MQTLVKFTLRLTTKVTTSPTWRRRSSSATSVSAWRSRPRATARTRPSSTDTSWPSRARARMRRVSRDTRSRAGTRLPASPVLMGVLDETAAVEQRGDAGAQRFVQALRAHRELGVDREALAQDEALGLGRPAELRDHRPRLLGVGVVGGGRRDAAPVVEPRAEEPRVDRRRISRQGAQQVGERRLG